MMTDPIADLLARIRNAARARHTEVGCPSSRTKLSIARLLAEEGYLDGVRVEARDGHPWLVIGVRFGSDGRPLVDGLRRISKPGRRVYVGAADVPRVRSGLGVAVISTSRGIMSDRAARGAGVGGEVVCEVW